jgi:hypothetical protein
MEEGEIGGKKMFVTNQHTADLTKPGVGALDLPVSFVALQIPAILVLPHMVVLPVRSNQLDTSPLPSLQQRGGIAAAVGDYTLGFLMWPTFVPRGTDLFERGVPKRNFCRRGTLQQNSPRNTFSVSESQPLYVFTVLDLTDFIALFLAGAKLLSRKASPVSASPVHPANQTTGAMLSDKLLVPLAVSTAASTSVAKDARQAGNAAPLRFAETTECLQDSRDSEREDGVAYPCVDLVLATVDRLTTIAHSSTTSAVSS